MINKNNHQLDLLLSSLLLIVVLFTPVVASVAVASIDMETQSTAYEMPFGEDQDDERESENEQEEKELEKLALFVHYAPHFFTEGNRNNSFIIYSFLSRLGADILLPPPRV